MNFLKVEEFVKRTASEIKTKLLIQELQAYVDGPPCHFGHTLYDRIIRACLHQLGLDSVKLDHVTSLVELVELALRGYDISTARVTKSSPLYMEKIIFHIVKKLSSLETPRLCSHVAELLYDRLLLTEQSDEYFVLVQSCFSSLWNASKGRKYIAARDKLHSQMLALSFLLLLETDCASSIVYKAPRYADDAIKEFENSCKSTSEDDAAFLVDEMQRLINRCLSGNQGQEKSDSSPRLLVLSEMVLTFLKLLCKVDLHHCGTVLVTDFERKAKERADFQCTAIVLGKTAVKIHSALKSGGDDCQALTDCARALRSLPPDLGDREAHSVLEGCRLVVWVVESGHSKKLTGPMLLSWFSFLEEHQELLLKTLKKNSIPQPEASNLQQVLCYNVYLGFLFAHESMVASQLDEGDTLDRVVLYCQATVGLMMTELQKLLSEVFLIKAVVAVSNFACGLYKRRLYDQAFTLAEILCKSHLRNGPTSLTVDRLSRPFMLAVESSRHSGKLERALDWVILWLKALGDKMTEHMSEPVLLWAKTKADAARNSDEDIRLRTLRDGFGQDVPDEQVMLFLLEEELCAYKEVQGDTAQERYNTLCDLLDICHEESPHSHLRAVYLCEMAKVVCYQDFSEQTDCAATDFTHEALRLFEEELLTPENTHRLKDEKAHALLWHYICNIEKKLQEAIEKDCERRKLREQQSAPDPIETNDLEFESKQKAQDSNSIYESLCFNLESEKEQCKPLERALDEWSSVLQSGKVNSVRNAKQTCSSIAVMAALFKLMGKPLKALRSYQLMLGVAQQLADAHNCITALCQSASILLDLGAPEPAMTQVEEGEKFLTPHSTTEERSTLSLFLLLLKAQCYYNTGQINLGLPYLCEVLKELPEQKHSKSWYVLRARTFSTCSSYLALDTTALPQTQRSCLTQHGISSPDFALYESSKLLSSLLLTVVGKNLYASTSSNTETRFIDQGDNLVLKWQLLSELLDCSKKMVAVRSGCGTINDARLQCLEALKLAVKLQAPALCAELLVMKAELELMKGERDESQLDLDKVRNLLEICSDFRSKVQKSEVKIKPRKGRPTKKSESPPRDSEDDLKGILTTRWIPKEVVPRDLASSPPLKSAPRRWLSSLAHGPSCQCPCCSEPCLARATARWGAVQAELMLHLDPAEHRASVKLQLATLDRCKRVPAKVGAQLSRLLPPCGSAKGFPKPALMDDVAGRVYLCMALSELKLRRSKAGGVWAVLDAGMKFVNSSRSPALRAVRANLAATKAIVSLVTLAAERGCSPEELFSSTWTWNPPTAKARLKAEDKKGPSLSSRDKKTREANDGVEKTTKAVKVAKVKTEGKGCPRTVRMLPPMTPATARSKPPGRVPDAFDFNTEVPVFACTPVQTRKAPSSGRKTQRTTSKLHFQVYKESSPGQRPVPLAPKRTKKSFFKVEFSEESDTEEGTSEKSCVAKKGSALQKAAPKTKAVPDLPAQKVLPKRQTRSKKSTAQPRPSSSEDEATASRRAAPTRTRASRRNVSPTKTPADSESEPDRMRAGEENVVQTLDVSFEQLRMSDTETEDGALKENTDLEVLRRDISCELERDTVSELKRDCLQSHPSHPDTRPDNLSLDGIQSQLLSAWLDLHHFPSPTTHAVLCSLLALAIGQQSPVTTAMLHAQSLGITSRHRTVRHLASSLRKLKRESNKLVDKMASLSVSDASAQPKQCTVQMLSQLEKVVSFPATDASSFPSSHCEEFLRLIQHLPPGLTVCMMSVVRVKPGQMGDSLILTRLEKGSAPLTLHIPTAKRRNPITGLVHEMESILAEQKAVSCRNDKSSWWEGRRALDSRVEKLLKDMETLLGCWRSLLLPLSSDPDIPIQAQKLSRALAAKGVTVSEDVLKIVLSASPVMTQEDLKQLAWGFSPDWDLECDRLLHAAVSRVNEREEPKDHIVLILDKYLQKLPWESTCVLKSLSVSRMPSLHSLIGLCIQKEVNSLSVLQQGVDRKKAFYVLDPDGNLEDSRSRFKEWFSSEPGWEGVCGGSPDSGQLEEAVSTKDLYIYVGHGAGARFLDGQLLLNLQMRAATLLFGCSSAALAVQGDQEGHGIVLNYLMAGCPFILGNLWDVTDRDMDRFTKALLESWFSAEPAAPLLQFMGPSRQVTYLKHLVGAAPIVYGLPFHLQ